MKIILNENQYKLLFEFDDFSKELTEIKNLIESGLEENIVLAFQIGEGMESYVPNFNMFGLISYNYGSLLNLIRIRKTDSMPQKLLNLFDTTTLKLSGHRLFKLPLNLDKLKNLQTLDLSSNDFSQFPMGLCSMTSLINIKLNDNKISEIPPCIANLKNLEYLGLRNNLLSEDDYKTISKYNPKTIISFTDNIYAQHNKVHRY
jgi:hypothetical protein